ncbi:ATP-binding cassette domain-containing protein [Alphaproteobacteria bacterium]|jgi:putative ABC transport system ATP-binding protein|nr:ATP-binding cassette domain-containing protein [Alphaproteobacteria bacterium]MDC0549098.1 ATP-binding cassette domain-containing protein [Alphaproteobacteria bacterium]MDC3273515.1 ATP-binding cassette domain-containing protein [Alphaproteobacteria bacterium]|tara:strand:+ start:508 stop:1146 length:639 start_codon:yes stop_codon:yes gene_type:complete
MLICENLSFSIDGHKLFSNINLNIENQKDLLITGPSGIGKTTLLSILCGLQKPTEGKVLYDDINLYNLVENKIDYFRGDKLGIVFQNFNLINAFTIKQNLELAKTTQGSGDKNLYDLLQRVGLADKSHIKVSKLSVGEKQRLAVARAFIGNPKWIFCDEPTSSLDDKNAEIISQFIKDESIRCKASLILITHDKRVQSILNFSQTLKLGEEL